MNQNQPPAPATPPIIVNLPTPSNGLSGEAQNEAQRKLAEKMHGPQSHANVAAERAFTASTSTLLTTDAHVGKREGEPHKDPAQEALKVGAATGTIDATAPVETVPISTGTPANEGKPTDTAVLGREGQGLATAPLGSTGHGADAVGVTEAIADATGTTPGEPKPLTEGAKPSEAAADPAHAGEADASTKGKPAEKAKPADGKDDKDAKATAGKANK